MRTREHRFGIALSTALGLVACSGNEPPSERDRDAAAEQDAAASAGNDAAAGISDSGTASDAAMADAATPQDAAASEDGASSKGTPVFVAVGYAGRRVRSTDLGQTWIDDAVLGGGGDDEYLLRAVTFGQGLFVAVGWKLLTSPDGRTWTERNLETGQWLGGIAFGEDRFVATGGYGTSAHSKDGVTFQPGGSLETQASRSLVFQDGRFVSATDAGTWWTSTDGAQWQVLSTGHASTQVAVCKGALREQAECSGSFNARSQAVGEGVIIRAENGHLLRSTDGGATFSSVLSDTPSLEAVAFGYVTD